MSTTEQSTEKETGCTGCGGCTDKCHAEAGPEAQEASGEVGIPMGLMVALSESVGKALAEHERAQKSELRAANLQEAQAYVQARYVPNAMDVVRLNANGRIVSNLPDGVETAVVARVFERPLTSGKVKLHGRFGAEVVDCTLLLSITEEDGTQAFTEMLFNSVFLELAA